MRKIAWIIAGLVLYWPLGLSAQSEDYDAASFARVTYVKGDVTVTRAGDLGSEEATVNVALVEGDRIGVREGRAEVDFGRKNFLRIDRGTEVEISNLPRGGDDRTRLHLRSGRIYLRVNSLDQEKNIEVHSPDASYYVLEEGLFRFDVRSNAETELAVIEGSIEAAGEGGSQIISSRERLVASNGRLGAQGAYSYSRDDFDNFNEDRDSKYSQYVSNRYLPSELSDYEEELSDNGSWVYEQPYGYVWAPRLNYSDWRPYYYGRWSWYASCGWTWIPDESWGWPVHHYGRWGWRLGLGWYWVPQVSWGPAWVHWYHGSDYYGWCPLSWYNYPCVLADNMYYDRYHGSHYPGHNRAMTVVHRNQLQNRHVSHVALSRQQASGLGHINLAARQPDVRPVINRSGLRSANSLGSGARTQIRSFERTLDRSSLGSLSRVTGRPADGSRAAGSVGRSASPRTVSPGGLSSGGRVTSNSRSTAGSKSTDRSSTVSRSNDRTPSARIQSAPKRDRAESGIPSRTNSPGTSGGRTYAPSSRLSVPDRGATVQGRQEPRRYSPSAGVSPSGTTSRARSGSSPDSQSRTLGRARQTDRSAGLSQGSSGTQYRPSAWPPSPYTGDRLEKSNAVSQSRARSFSGDRSSAGKTFSSPGRSSSGSRSTFSPPNRSSSSSGRSDSASSRSTSGSRSSFSTPSRSSSGSSRSFSAPSRSSSSAGRSVSSPGPSSGSGSGRSTSSGSSRGSSGPSSRGAGGRGSRRG